MVGRAWLSRALSFDRAGLQPASALRAGLGVVLPLAVGSGLGHPAEGAQVAAGALPVGVALMTGAFGPPAGLMVATTLGMTVSTFVGSLVAGHPVAMLPMLALWGFVAGLMVALGRAASVVGVQAVVGFVVFGRYPGGVDVSAAHAGWVLVGGGMQLVLAHLLRTPRRFGRERRALAAAYDALAVFADGVMDGASGVVAAEAVAQADALVTRRLADDSGGVGEMRGLVDEAVRVRLELHALAAVQSSPGLRRLVADSAAWLHGVARALRAGEAPDDEPGGVAEVVDDLRRRRDTTTDRFIAARSSALLGQLRAAQRLASALSGGRRLPLPRIAGLRPTLDLASAAGSAWRRLRLAAEPHTPEMRHAIRLAVLLPVAELVADVLPWQRGWWVILTAAVVVRPDYAATMQRGVARVLGTAAGVVVAGVIVGGLHPHDVALTLLVGAFAWASYTVFSASYAIYTFLLTGVVVLLVSTFDPRPLSAVADRGLDTLVGGALALLAYAVWPTKEAPTLLATTARLLDALATYADVVLAVYADPDAADTQRVADAARTARRARADSQASLDRATAEPSWLRPDTQEAVGVLAAARRIVVTLHSLRATVQDSPEAVLVPELEPLRHALVDALRATADRASVPVDLREAQHRLEDAAAAEDVATWRGRRLALAAAHLDPLVDSIHTIEHLHSEADEPDLVSPPGSGRPTHRHP